MKYRLPILLLAILFCSLDETDELGELFQQKKYSQVVRKGNDFLSKDAGNALVHYLVGRSYIELGVLDSGKWDLHKTIQLDKDETYMSGWANAYLGLAFYLQDSLQSARKHLQRCVTLNKTENSTVYAKTLLSGTKLNSIYDAWAKKETEHFIFHFQDTNALRSMSDFVSGRELAYQNVHKYFTTAPPHKCDYYVWNSREEASGILPTKIGFTQADICLIHSYKDQTTGHEITHLLSYWSIKPLTTSKFINEGLAVHFDQSHSDRLKVAKLAFRNSGFTGVLDIWARQNSAPTRILYDVSGAFMEFLHEKGTDEQFRALIYEQTTANAEKLYGDKWKELTGQFDQLLHAD